MLEKNPNLHYKDISGLLAKSGLKVNPGTVNALMSQDSRFESDGNGVWRVVGRSESELSLKNEIASILESRKRPMYVPQIVACLVGSRHIKPQDGFLVKKVLVGNNFIRWGTSDYFALKNQDIPTANIGDFFSSKIIEFFNEHKKPVHRNNLADYVAVSSGIYVNPDGGFYAELSRLIKRKAVTNLGKSIIAPEKSASRHLQSNVTEMIHSVFAEKQKPMLFRELKKTLVGKFGIEFKSNTLSSALTEDSRFASSRRGFWHLKKWEYEKSRSLYQPGARKDYLTNPVSEKSLKDGYIVLRPLVYEFFPDTDTQIIIEVFGKKMLVDYDESKKRLSRAQKLIESLELSKGDRLHFTLKDVKLKVYALETEKAGSFADEIISGQTVMNVPSKSSEGILFTLRDVLTDSTKEKQKGTVFSADGGRDVCRMLSGAGRSVSLVSARLSEKIVSEISFENRKQEYLFVRNFKTHLAAMRKTFSGYSRKFYFSGRNCSSCGSEKVIYRHVIGTDAAEILCSNLLCPFSSIRKAAPVKFYENDFRAFKELLDSCEYDGDHFLVKFREVNLTTTRNAMAAASIVKEIGKIEDLNLKTIFAASLINSVEKNAAKEVLSDVNLFFDFFLAASSFFRSYKDFIRFRKDDDEILDFAVLRDEPENFYKSEETSRLIADTLEIECNKTEPFEEPAKKVLVKVSGDVFFVRKIKYYKNEQTESGIARFLSGNFKEVQRTENTYEGEEIIKYGR